MEESFASVSDLEARWRGLTAREQERAEVLLADASALIRDLAPTWDRVSVQSLKRIACAMVQRAMNSPVGFEGAPVASFQETTGPYAAQVSFANPTSDLYLTKPEKATLGIGGRAKAFSVTPATNQQGVGRVF